MATTSRDDLRVRVEKRNVLAIIGAGVSIGATNNSNPVASWTDLLNDGVKYCVGHDLVTDKGWTRMVLAQIKRKNDTESLLSAAEAVMRTLGGPQGGPYRNWLSESVGSLKVIDPSVIETLHALKILLTTTNYDGLIEEVTRLKPVTWKDRAAFER